jgi:protein MpaA
VDLNRNLPTKDWAADFTKFRYYPGKEPSSESENQALLKILDSSDYSFIFTLHSWKPMLNTNGDCSQIQEALEKATGYKIVPDIGYPTPGSLGAFGATDRGIPTLTYELEKGMDQEEIITVHVPALMKALSACEKRFCK